MESIVLTIIGPDRPGLIESVAKVVQEHGGSWVESRMSRMAGQFAGILRIQVPADEGARACAALEALNTGTLRVLVARGDADTAADARGVVLLELVGTDRPGIIRKISSALAARDVNVEELSTGCEGAPWSGDTLFKAHARLRVPAGMDLQSLRVSLEEIANDLMVDISIGDPSAS